MKNFILTLFAFCIAGNIFSQQKFSQSMGGAGNDEALYCKPTQDGGYINVGWTTSYGAGNWDLYLVKTDAAGQIMWTRTYGGTGDEADCSVEQTSDKGYIIASRTNSFGVGNSDIYIVKTDSLGNLMWSKTYGGSEWEEGHSIIILSDGFVHVGFTGSFGAGFDDIYIMKSDFLGNMIWAKTIGGTSIDHGHKVKQDVDGGFLIAGATNSFNNESFDFYLLKLSNQGNLLWSKTYGGNQDDIGWDVQAVMDGYFLTGYTLSVGNGLNDMLLIKTDLNGALQWSKTFGGEENDLAYAIEKTSDNNLLITGETESFGNGDEDIFLIKTDFSGNFIWAKTYGGLFEDGSQYAQNASDGGYIVSGYTQSFGAGKWDFYMIKTDQDGNASDCNKNDVVISAVSQSISDNNPATTIADAPFLTGSNPNTIVSGGGQSYQCSPLAVLNTEKFSIALFPNPCNDFVILQYSQVPTGYSSKMNYKLSNIQGQIIGKGNFDAKHNGTININTQALEFGIYFIEVYDYNELAYIQKIIKN